MKNTRLLLILTGAVMFAAIFAGYYAGILYYKEYQRKSAYFDKKITKVSELEKSLGDLYHSLENAEDEKEMDKKEILSKIEEIRHEIRSWQVEQRAAIADLRSGMDELKVDRLERLVLNLREEMNEFRMSVQDLNIKVDEIEKEKSVDLGRISVTK